MYLVSSYHFSTLRPTHRFEKVLVAFYVVSKDSVIFTVKKRSQCYSITNESRFICKLSVWIIGLPSVSSYDAVLTIIVLSGSTIYEL